MNNATPVKKGKSPIPIIPKEQYILYRKCLEIKHKYPNGVPLNKEDRSYVLQALRMHPKGKQKFGRGIKAVVIDEYIYGSRCFFVVRGDNSVEDFSIYKCFGGQGSPRNNKVLTAMQRFNYMAVINKIKMMLTNPSQKGF